MSRVAAVEARLDEYSGLLNILNSKGSQVCRNGLVTVYVGDGYFVDMPLEDAKQFVHKRVLTLEQQLQQAKYAEGITSDDLPIMDIIEELDEDGNVVEAKVERADGSMDQIRELLRKVETAENTEKNRLTPVEEVLEDTEPRIREIIEPETPAETRPAETKPEPSQAKSEPTEAAPEALPGSPTKYEAASAAAPPSQPFNGISKEDMIQLEILEQDLNDVKMSEDEYDEFDEDFEEEYDDEASEESDEDEFGRTRGSLFPSDPRTTSLLERHLQESRTSKTGGKSVSFSPALEIKEFETSSAERKGKLENERPPSRFKMEREAEAEPEADTKAPKQSLFSQRLGLNPRSSAPSQSQSQSDDAVRDTIFEKGVPAAAVVAKPTAPAKSSASATKKFSSLSRKPSATPTKAKVIAVPTSDQVPAEYEQLANDSVDLRDLEEEALHYFEEATIPDDEFLALHDRDEPMADEPMEDEEVPDRPTMSGIVERAPQAPQGLSEQDEDLKQIKADYQRLRQKLVYKAGGYKKTDNDKATDVVDEDGNVKSVSRFKAARLGLR